MNFGNDYDRRYNANAENCGAGGRTNGRGGATRGYFNGNGRYNDRAGRYDETGRYSDGSGKYGDEAGGYNDGTGRHSDGSGRYSDGAGGYGDGNGRYSEASGRGVPNAPNRGYAKNEGYGRREYESRGRTATMPPPTYTKKPSGGQVLVSTKALVAVVCLIVFLFVSFLIVAFLPSNSEKEGENGGNFGAGADTGNVAGGNVTGSDGDDGSSQNGGAVPSDDDKFVICIDPGHGYDDIGTSYKYLGDQCEKDINLKVSLLVVKNLRDMGYDVVMTRDSDTPPDSLEPNVNGDYVINPAWRCDFANSNKVDLFVSLHCNSYESDEKVNGARLYFFAESKYDSEHLGNLISKAIQDGLSVTRPSVTGLGETEAYAVTKRVEAPSVLIEMGFATNKTDAENLLNDEWQQKMAKAISDGIASYIRENET